MLEFMKMVVLSQPLIWVALGCVVLSAFITLFFGRDFNCPRLLHLFPNGTETKWPRWVCGILLTTAVVILIALTIINHTTLANDILAFLTVMAFSVLLIYVAQIIFFVLMVVGVIIIIGTWWLVNRYIIK